MNGIEGGVSGEANIDGSINIDSNIPRDSAHYRRVMRHELQHKRDMESERASYGENHVVWEGNIYFRQNGMIDGPAGRLPEGHEDHPWEQSAIEAEASSEYDHEIEEAERGGGGEEEGESPYKFKIGKYALGGLASIIGKRKRGNMSEEDRKSMVEQMGMMGMFGRLRKK